MSTDRSPVVARRVGAFLREPPGLANGTHVLVAVSGGPDSTALALALAENGKAAGLRLTLAHLRHGVRSEADERDDDACVATLGERLGVPVVTRALAVPPGGNLEARARRARRQAFRELAADVGATHVALGHTRDDQAETLLLRLLRGGGRRGLGAMRPRDGLFVRPMLDVSRADVRWYLARRGVDAAIDRTNADLRFSRNRVRRMLVPLLEAEFNPNVAAALAALARRLRDEDDVLATLANDAATRLHAGDKLACAVAHLPAALARRVVRSWLASQGLPDATAAETEQVLRLAAGRRGAVVSMRGGRRVAQQGEVLAVRTAAPDEVSFDLALPPGGMAAGPGWVVEAVGPRAWRADEAPRRGPDAAVIDADGLAGPLRVRSVRPGDRVRVPRVGTRKVSDLLIDRKLARDHRARVPLVVAGDEVLWIPRVVRGGGARVGPATRQVLDLTFRIMDGNVALPLVNPYGSVDVLHACTERGRIE